MTILQGLPGIELVAASGIYLTEPQGLADQPWFANQVLHLICSVHSPFALLKQFKAIEENMGREPSVRFGPRLIDVDLLLYGDTVVDTEVLTVPHPRMSERAFVLVPLLEIAPQLRFPSGEKGADVLQNLAYSVQGKEIRQDCAE